MRPILSLLVSFCIFTLASCTGGEPFQWTPGSPNLIRHTVKELRDLHIVKQQEDYSCGAAALATLLIYYFGDQTTEKELLTLLEQDLTDEERTRKATRGFSLLDLKRVAQAKGYRAGGFRLSMSQLAQVSAPVIVFLEPLDYKHFAVYRGLDRGRVYIADPARGNLRMTLGRFLSEWSGVVFVLSKAGEEQLKDYPLRLPYPLDSQPELRRFSGQLDFGSYFPGLIQR